jgi:transposase-like protein
VRFAVQAGGRCERLAGGRLHGVNTNQVFHWRRMYQAGDLSLPVDSPTNFLPVVVSDALESCEETPNDEPVKRSVGLIHVEFPGRALVRIESGVDPALASAVLERLMR